MKSPLLALALLPILSLSGCKRAEDLPAPAFTLSSQQFFKEFKDEKAANEKYLGKVVEVSGVVERTGTDSAGQKFVSLEGEPGLGEVQCFIQKRHPDESAAVQKGQRVTLRGTVLNRVIYATLDNCRFVQNPS